jgi:hypothetical protein
MKHSRFIVILLVLVLVTLACGSAGVATEPVSEPPSPSTVATNTSSPANPPPNVSAPPATLDLDNPALYDEPEDVDTYITTMDYQFESSGTLIGSVRMGGATQVEPYETALEFDTEGRAVMGGGEMFYFTQIAGTQYTVYEGFDCLTSAPGVQENPFEVMLDLGGMLKGEAQYIGEETVNNIEAYAYSITQDNIDTSDPAGMSVETINESRIHVAKETGYVVRLFIDGAGRVSVLSGDPSLLGDVYYELNYFDFGVPVDVQIPPGCPGSAVEVEYPVPNDAANLTNVGGVVSFETQLTMEGVITFYTTEMPALGCGAPQQTGVDPLITLTFDCASGKINLILAPNGSGGIAVNIFKAP